MKAKYALIVLLAITFWGCDDNTAGLGLRMFPESDRDINGKLSTFDVITESVHAGKIYAMTNVGYVGKFTDETFGTYQAGFLAQLNCPEGMTFPGVYNKTALDSKGKATQIMVGDDNEDNKDVTFIRDDENKIIGNIHTIELYLWYSSYFGDSLTACRLSVYELGEAEKELNQENALVDGRRFLRWFTLFLYREYSFGNYASIQCRFHHLHSSPAYYHSFPSLL